MFQHLLISWHQCSSIILNNKPKMFNIGPKLFWPWLLVWSKPKIGVCLFVLFEYDCAITLPTCVTMYLVTISMVGKPLIKKKNPIYKNQGWEPIHQKYEGNESTSRHNPHKKKQTNKQTINKNKIKTLCK